VTNLAFLRGWAGARRFCCGMWIGLIGRAYRSVNVQPRSFSRAMQPFAGWRLCLCWTDRRRQVHAWWRPLASVKVGLNWGGEVNLLAMRRWVWSDHQSGLGPAEVIAQRIGGSLVSVGGKRGAVSVAAGLCFDVFELRLGCLTSSTPFGAGLSGGRWRRQLDQADAPVCGCVDAKVGPRRSPLKATALVLEG